ncbi:MAG: MerR family transcriptional regulator [Deltaproteobacteria bacterium]|nr:MerR family transcriptional regulator [Deltaproteobacteria bacterium]
MTDEPAEQLTIDQLASASGVPSRTIRFYQSRGALMNPEIRGRVAYYGKPHVERLKLIAQLQDRGLRIDAIGDLMKRIDRGEVDLAEWLGVEEQVQAPWALDHARTVTEAELYELAGSRRPGLLADLQRAHIIERKGDVFLLGSPALLAIAVKLEAVGIDLETATEASKILRKHLGRAVGDLVDMFVHRIEEGHVPIDNASKLFETFRVVGVESVRVLFAREMEGELRKLLASGKLAAVSARARKKKR